MLPHNIATCFDDGITCSDNYFCACHSSINGGSNNEILYSDQPFTFLDNTNGKDCQYDNNSALQEPNGNIGDVAIKAVSHELSETITDPLGNAWYDSQGNENGDKCNAYGSGAGLDITSFTPALGGSAGAGTLFNQIDTPR